MSMILCVFLCQWIFWPCPNASLCHTLCHVSLFQPQTRHVSTTAVRLSIDPAANACFTSAGGMAEWTKHHTDESRRRRKSIEIMAEEWDSCLCSFTELKQSVIFNIQQFLQKVRSPSNEQRAQHHTAQRKPPQHLGPSERSRIATMLWLKTYQALVPCCSQTS